VTEMTPEGRSALCTLRDMGGFSTRTGIIPAGVGVWGHAAGLVDLRWSGPDGDWLMGVEITAAGLEACAG